MLMHIIYLSHSYIYVATIPLLTDQKMTDLGIKTVGECAMLCNKCREFEQSK